MATTLLFAIGIDEVRELFGATPEIAARLRGIASSQPAPVPAPRQHAHASHHRQRLADTGPAPLNASELEALIAGHYVEPDRLASAWQVVVSWLSALCWDHCHIAASSEQLSAWDFQLAVAGLPSRYSLAQLWGRDAQIPLRPAPGMHIGYVRGHHVLAGWGEMAPRLTALDSQTVAALAPLTGLLGRFGQWGSVARAHGRPEPDLFTVGWQDGPGRVQRSASSVPQAPATSLVMTPWAK
ncbi:hypothetical protein SAMN05443377_13017 [Propionibacterium cyclohexanicum]|uniref:Uncharacterized protein n=1 Tax=Propionibacterium cyclohexanicum TaxID=64702 RepID=A0A1H9TWK2_9ACTN|nr:hypothetical protein [Propionibacterium cyclohexanicum]SES01506.1 hypothetical protein SAMN05443377_13017 [Propionibacterium cyclohexanicum]